MATVRPERSQGDDSPDDQLNPARPAGAVVGGPPGGAPFAANGGGNGHAGLRELLHQHLLATVSSHRGERQNEDDLRVELLRLAGELAEARSLDGAARKALVEEVLGEVFGYGPIEDLMHDPDITDILINGPRQVNFEKRGQLQHADVAFRDEGHLMQVVRRMLAGSGRRLDDDCRMVDARLPDGSRVNVVLKPPALNGPLVSIRRFGARPLTVTDLLVNESLTQEMLTFLAACVKARLNMVISGGTGTGKTTLLNALSQFIPASERVVTIEDTAELELQQRHVAKMEAVHADPDGGGAVSVRDLVRNSLRMRPDRIIVGECRGAEALDMLQAMNTGHEGSITTVHANDTRDALARIELMIGLAGVEIPVWAVRKLVASAVHLIVQVARLPGGRRKVATISEITGMEGDVVSMHDLFEFVQKGVDADQAVVGWFRATGLRPRCLTKLQVRGADVTPQLFAERVLQTQRATGPRR
jgi:pilus assembly protein CpaF